MKKQIEETKNKLKNYIDVYIKTNNKSIDNKNNSDKEIDQKPVKKIKQKKLKK